MTPTPRDEARRLARSAIRGEFKPEALHAYTDENGEAIYWRIRARLADGGKWIRPMRRSGDACELSEPEFPHGKPLYRLHELASAPGAPCWYLEGENCADALAKLGVLATTAGGATSDEHAQFAPLAGRTVTIWPDNDNPGMEHGGRVAAKLRAIGCYVETIDAAALELPEGGDVVDWLKGNPNGTAADLAKLPRQCGTKEAKSSERKLTLEPIGKLLAEKGEETRWLVDGLLPAGGISILAARPKVGKSTLGRDLAVKVVRGEDFLGKKVAKGPVFILDLEGKRDETVSALRQLGAGENDAIKIFCGTAPQNAFAQLKQAALAERPALIEIDTMQRLARISNLNDYAEVSLALDAYIALARESGAHVLLHHHQGRTEGEGVDAPMGSTAIAGSVDTILTMRRRKGDDAARTISSVQRYGQDMPETMLTMDASGRVNAAGFARDHDRQKAEDAVLAYVAAHPSVEQSEIRECVAGRWAIVRAALSELVKPYRPSGKGLVRTGKGTRGEPFKYSVSGSRGSQEPAEPENQNLRPPKVGASDDANSEVVI